MSSEEFENVREVVRRSRKEYPEPDLGNKEDPLEELVYINPSCVLKQAIEAQRQHEEEDFQFEALCGHGVNGGRKPLFKV